MAEPILLFYWRLFKGVPGRAREAWEQVVGWLAVLTGVLVVFNPELAKSIQASWDGFSRLWAALPFTFFALLRVARSNHAEFQRLQGDLDAVQRNRPVVETRLVDSGELIFLEIENAGATAVFGTRYQFRGTEKTL